VLDVFIDLFASENTSQPSQPGVSEDGCSMNAGGISLRYDSFCVLAGSIMFNE